VGYFLDEDTNWSLDIGELKRAVDAARKVCEPRALCVINPGNPTGQVLTRENIERTIKFAKEEKLLLCPMRSIKIISMHPIGNSIHLRRS
ncbi:PREDICTED: alanine aminotransferase 1-like, partial [Priapulus caudatus]|uniref:alanine transaminase n=1 Tax=Priapulus caudatus TaxID=37621 RepID=A0ABM1DW84_PRICU